MNKLLLSFVVVGAFIGIKAVAEIGMNPPALPTNADEEYYMCMWSDEVKDCVDGNKNYCICVVDDEEDDPTVE